MKYLDFTSGYISVRILPGHWMPRKQAAFLSKAVCQLLDIPVDRELCTYCIDGARYFRSDSSTAEFERIGAAACIEAFFGGSASADSTLRLHLTPAEYRILDGIANFTSGETATKRQSIFVASDLNTGRNLVLVARV